ncbi:hypothetical protein D3C86_1834620 [compost metagenome]
MMRPQSFCFMPGSARRVVWKAEVRLMAMIASQRSGGKSSMAATCWMPALLTRILAPCAASAFAMPSPMPLVEPVTSAVLPLSM